ncbi:amidase [Amycolatopsis azurea]|uniref:Amidase n=1 Tax=Amycolatopsis azurea DSM 43854 TaxID=1238180 RepID=M2P2W3_9PSEU|nr:amidase [Amycolatopsis azurea]EMD29489.1 Aspartyl-tRNA(Asn) amidotransferase subunit A [Amycolatopsis azurea DSM 43854]OOC02731.1 amidase [Amycolatopsis azurea DSM 43854]
MELNFPTAEELTAALQAGEVTSVELTDEAIDRIERDDKAINAICVPDFDRARAAARDADQARARGEDRPLLGVPVTVKECYDIAGLPTTWGMPAYRDHLPAEDAVQVARLRAAGAVVLGKTNVPLGLQDLQSFNELYGTTNNPWDHERTAGGSSGGSAAALAAGFGALSIGTDLAGSLRTPAHFCGVYAHKPTVGLAATRGMVPPDAPAWPIELDLAVAGPMARTARDLSLLLDVMAGPDPLTYGLAYDVALPPARHQRLEDFRVLVLDEHPFLPTGSAVRAGVNRVADALADGGARVERHSPLLPDLAEAATLYTLLLFSGSVARFPVEEYEQLRIQAAGLSADDQSLDAARLRGMVFSHRDWLEVNNRRELHRHGWRRFFAEFDAVVCPITPTPAFPHDHDPDLLQRRIDIDGAEYPFFEQLVWAGLATMPGLPATAVPTGRSAEGLPVGVQLIGPMFEDRTPLRLAELLEQRIGGFQAPR